MMTLSNLDRVPEPQRLRIEAIVSKERADVGKALDAAVTANGDVGEVTLVEGDMAIEDVIARALFRRERALKAAMACVRATLVAVGILAFSGVAAYAVLWSDVYWSWKLTLGCPAGIVAILAFLFLVSGIYGFFYENYDDLSWEGEAWKSDLAKIGYRSGSGWRLGDKGIYVRGSWVHDQDWTLSNTFVPYKDIHSIILHQERKMIGFVDGRDGSKVHVLWDIVGRPDALATALEFLWLSRTAGHEVQCMRIVPTSISSAGGHVPQDVLARFASAFPDCAATADNSYFRGRISVLMENSGEVPLLERVASFEGYQVEYRVLREPEDISAGADQEIHKN
jgi:hypothetical protein